MVMGTMSLDLSYEGDSDNDEELMVESANDLDGMNMEEHVEGKYDCPEFILSKHEEKRIHNL